MLLAAFFYFVFLAIILAALLTLFLFLPLWFLVTGIKRKRKARIVIAAIWLAVSCPLALLVADSFSSRHERILDHGHTPDGREYVLFQTCTGEPYSVQFYVRNEQREWQYHFVTHEDWPWRDGGRVEFHEGKAHVFRGGRRYSTIYLRSSANARRHPATMTAEEVFESSRAR